MKAHCLYKIENPHDYYLYVLQMKNYVDTMDILAIRSDFIEAIIPLYSPSIEYKEDLGYPTTKVLIDISHSFYTAVKTAIICCDLHLRGSTLRERVGMFLKESIGALCYNNITHLQDGQAMPTNINTQHTIFAAINRTLPEREVTDYVQNKLPVST